MVVQLSVKSKLSRLAFVACLASSFVTSSAQHQGYSVHKVMDSKGSGGLAMTYEIPQGWTTQDSVVWNLNLRLNPMCYSFTAGSADHATWVSYLSGLTFDFASNGYGGFAGKPPPARASDFLLDNFKAVHPGAQFEIVDQQDTPIPFPYTVTVKGVVAGAFHSTLSVRFSVNGLPMQENLSEDVYGYRQPTGPSSFRGNWFVSGMTVVNAPEGQMGNAVQICNTMLGSEKMTKSFQDRYQKVATMLLAKTKAENVAAQRQRAHQVIVARSRGGGGSSRVMDKDTFILHEAIKGLRSRIFSRSIGN